MIKLIELVTLTTKKLSLYSKTNKQMKKLLLLSVAAILMFSCNKTTSGYQITGIIDQVEDGEKAVLEITSEQGTTIIYSTIVKNGTFEFNGQTDEIQVGYIQIGEVLAKIPFVLENEKITLKAYKDSIQASVQGGSYNNKEFYKTNQHFFTQSKKIQQFEQDNIEDLRAIMIERDTTGRSGLIKEYEELQKSFKNYMMDYSSNHPKSYLSVVMLSQLLGDPETDIEKVKNNFDALAPEIKATSVAKRTEEHIQTVLERLENLKSTEVGQIAPDFSAPDPEGNVVSLKESLGKITLIDFWASWCGPCRVENPNVVALYNEFHDKGLNIIGVSLDREDHKEKWLEAIATDKLTWTQVSNLQYWQDPIAKQYNVQSIPATFLLDADGKIIAKNLRGAALRAKVAEVLGE